MWRRQDGKNQGKRKNAAINVHNRSFPESQEGEAKAKQK